MQAWTTAALGSNATCAQIVDYWIGRMFGYTISTTTRNELIAFLAQGNPTNQPPKVLGSSPDWNDPRGLYDRFNNMLQLMAMSPEFQYR